MNMEELFDLKIAEIAFQEMLKDWGISEDDCLDLLTSKWQNSEKELGFDLANEGLAKRYGVCWLLRREVVWQKLDERFLENHCCHTDEIWFEENSMGDPIGSKSRCPECRDAKERLNKISGFLKH